MDIFNFLFYFRINVDYFFVVIFFPFRLGIIGDCFLFIIIRENKVLGFPFWIIIILERNVFTNCALFEIESFIAAKTASVIIDKKDKNYFFLF